MESIGAVPIALLPEAWSAIAAWVSAVATLVTASIAIAAAVIARKQLGEARRVREEQAQPYVAVFMADSAVNKFQDLVIRNFGTTAAKDIAVKIEPIPSRASTAEEGYGEVWLPKEIPTLVPGQEWRTLWDFTPTRVAQGLPDQHTAIVTFEDSQGTRFELSYDLDWGATRNRMSVREYTVHDGAKALRDMSKDVKKLPGAIRSTEGE